MLDSALISFELTHCTKQLTGITQEMGDVGMRKATLFHVIHSSKHDVGDDQKFREVKDELDHIMGAEDPGLRAGNAHPFWHAVLQHHRGRQGDKRRGHHHGRTEQVDVAQDRPGNDGRGPHPAIPHEPVARALLMFLDPAGWPNGPDHRMSDSIPWSFFSGRNSSSKNKPGNLARTGAILSVLRSTALSIF